MQPQRPVATLIDEIIQKIPGWTPADQLLSLYLLAVGSSHLKGDIMEIGSWCGRSAMVLAEAAKLSGTGHVWAIDLFPAFDDWTTNPDGTHSFSVDVGGKNVGSYQDQTVWDEPFQKDIVSVYQRFPTVLEAFYHSVQLNDASEWVTPFRGTSAMFLQQRQNDLNCRLAFIDGDHSYNAVCEDIDAVESVLISGGWIAFDDAFSHYDGVNKAIENKIIKGHYDCAQQLTRKLFVARRK